MCPGLGDTLADDVRDLVVVEARLCGNVGRGFEAPDSSSNVIHPLSIPHPECQQKGRADVA